MKLHNVVLCTLWRYRIFAISQKKEARVTSRVLYSTPTPGLELGIPGYKSIAEPDES